MKHLRIFFIGLLVWGCTPEPEEARILSFTHGVASGDPDSASVVLWTRAVPEDSANLSVEWEVSRDAEFTEIVRTGTAQSDRGRDFTFKAVADSLEPDARYYYRFRLGDIYSEVGRTRTAPVGMTKDIRFAVVSCSNYEWGYFNAYGAIAEMEDIDAVLHLGDYIYEYGVGVYGDTTLGRLHDPAHEILDVEDYRRRYRQYRSDPDLARVHKTHPFITIWDDHEIANNAYVSGAQNHQDEEGDYMQRRAIARQVYYEWMPVREGDELYRSFSFGDMAELFMLDERLAGRTAPVSGVADETYSDSSRSMLGNVQLKWLKKGLQESDAVWQVLGNQVIFSYLNWNPSGETRNMDAWDGYPVEQAELAKFLKDLGKNVIITTGDTHSSWAFEVVTDPFNEYNEQTGQGALALEFGVTSINSANANESNPDEEVIEREKSITGPPVNPHLKYTNLRDHGFLILHLEEYGGRAEFHFVNTVKEQDDSVYTGKTFYFTAGKNTLSNNPANSEGE